MDMSIPLVAMFRMDKSVNTLSSMMRKSTATLEARTQYGICIITNSIAFGCCAISMIDSPDDFLAQRCSEKDWQYVRYYCPFQILGMDNRTWIRTDALKGADGCAPMCACIAVMGIARLGPYAIPCRIAALLKVCYSS